MARRIDKDDLLVFEDSFDDSFGESLEDDELDNLPLAAPGMAKMPSSPAAIPSSPPASQDSPVKQQNRQFEADFVIDLDSDFSDDTPRSSRKHLTSLKNHPQDHATQGKLTSMVNQFKESQSSSQPKGTRISQLCRSSPQKPENQKPAPKKLAADLDLDEIFADDLAEAQPSLQAEHSFESQTIQISGPETSSPTYHRLETLYPTIPQTRQRDDSPLKPSPSSGPHSSHTSTTPHGSFFGPNTKPPVKRSKVALENVDFSRRPSEDENNTPLNASASSFKQTSTQVPATALKSPRKPLYPVLEKYDERYPGISRSIFEECRAKRTQQKPDAILPIPPPQGRTKKGAISGVDHLMKRPKSKNPELMLMTQRPTTGALTNARAMSTSASPKPKVVEPVILSEEQADVLERVVNGESLFYTGSAGTGKSVLLRSIIKRLKTMYRPGEVAVTASTGIAACNIGGVTLHSFSGIGLGKEDVEKLTKKVRRNRKSNQRWKNVKVLIIDEISMISGELLDKLDHIACALRKDDRPFGGIQVVCCGDFFQLPPVSTEAETAGFCFDSAAWKRSMKSSITLQTVFRQKGDLEFIEMLNDMRLGIVTSKSLMKFRELERELDKKGKVEPAELFATRAEVERANAYRLNSLNTQLYEYNALDGGFLTDEDQRFRLLQNFMAPPLLQLKKGAQVMMIKNIDGTLVNGSLGKVIDFIDRDTYLAYEMIESGEFDDDKLESYIDQKLASTVDKDSGKSLPENPKPKMELKLESTVFDFLGEVRSDDAEQEQSNQRKRDLMNKLHNSSRGQKLPLVRFLTPSQETRTVLVTPETWTVEDEKQKPLVSRTQLPLMLAWALSIHKSQGQTLPLVRVNLKRVFEKGQAYVAISRAVSREGLQILNFDENKVFAHHKVIDFYNKLETVGSKAKQKEKEVVYDGSVHPEPHTVSRTRYQPPRVTTRARNIDIAGSAFYNTDPDPVAHMKQLHDHHMAPPDDFDLVDTEWEIRRDIDDESAAFNDTKRRSRPLPNISADWSGDDMMAATSEVAARIAM